MKTRPNWLPYVVFFLLAFIFLVGYVLSRVLLNSFSKESHELVTVVGDLSKDLAVMLGAVVVLELLWSKMGGDPLGRQIEKLAELTDLHSDGQKTGLKRIKVGELPEDWLAKLKKCEERVELAGYMLHPFADNPDIRSTLTELATKGVKIRILLFDSSNEALKYIVQQDHLKAMQTMMDLNFERFSHCRPTDKRYSKNLEVGKLKTGVIDFSYYRFDGELHVIPYTYRVETPASPVLVIRGDSSAPLFRLYTEAFDGLFKQSLIDNPPPVPSSPPPKADTSAKAATQSAPAADAKPPSPTVAPQTPQPPPPPKA